MGWESKGQMRRRKEGWVRMLTVALAIALVSMAYSVAQREKAEDLARDQRNLEAVKRISWEAAYRARQAVRR